MMTRKQQKRIMLRRSDSAIKKEILELLIFNGPLKLTHIDCIANINCNKLKKLLDNLKDTGFIVERKTTKKNCSYSITSKGLTAYRESQNTEFIVSNRH